MVSDKLTVINKGQLIAQGTVEEIKNLVEEKFRVVVEGDTRRLEKFINNHPSVNFRSRRVIYVNNGDEAIELVRKVLKIGLKWKQCPLRLKMHL